MAEGKPQEEILVPDGLSYLINEAVPGLRQALVDYGLDQLILSVERGPFRERGRLGVIIRSCGQEHHASPSSEAEDVWTVDYISRCDPPSWAGG